MTKKQIENAIKELGMTARWSTDYQEWKVNYRKSDSRFNGDTSAYFTDDSNDALETALAMSRWNKVNE